MTALLFALALAAAQPVGEASAQGPAPASAEPRTPVGAPSDDYGLVAWCYGALGGWLDLYDQVMPEVTRIERTWRRPGSSLAEDLKVYDDMRQQGRRELKGYETAIEQAERASVRPISARGAEAIRQGRANWSAAAAMPPARVAQEWMSWSLPATCQTTARSLEERSRLMAATLDQGGGAPGAQADPGPDPSETPQAPPGDADHRLLEPAP